MTLYLSESCFSDITLSVPGYIFCSFLFQAMMDRDKKDELPKMQVGFIDAICLPVYEVLLMVFFMFITGLIFLFYIIKLISINVTMLPSKLMQCFLFY
jgi:hypothetical protein